MDTSLLFYEDSNNSECLRLRRNFDLMCVSFAINISCVISVLSYASAILGKYVFCVCKTQS